MDVVSNVAIPQKLNYEMPPELKGSRSYMISAQPDGLQSVSLSSFPATPFVQTSTGDFGNLGQSDIVFSLQCGQGENIYLDTLHTSLSFSMTYSIPTTASSVTGAYMNIISSAASFFDRLQLVSGGQVLESINQYALLQHFLLSNTLSITHRIGTPSICMGADSNTSAGIELAHSATGNYRYNFTIPLISLIGLSTDKLFPIGSLNNLQLVMTTAQRLPIASYCATATTQPVITNFLLSEFSLNCKYVNIGEQMANEMRSALVNGKHFIKGSSYIHNAPNIPNGTSGTTSLLLQIRANSVKSIYSTFGIGQSAVCPNGYFDSFNPCLTSRQLQVGENLFPTKPLNDCFRGSEAYQYLAHSLGGSLISLPASSVTRDSYFVQLPSIVTGSDTSYVIPASGKRPNAQNADGGTDIVKYPNSFHTGYDCETLATTMFCGQNTRSSPPFLNLYLSTATTSAVTCNCWGLIDVILVFDVASKSVQAIF